MKKRLIKIALLLCLSLVISLSFIVVSHQEEPSSQPSSDTVKDILREALDLRRGMGYMFTWYEGIEDPDQIPHIAECYNKVITYNVFGEDGGRKEVSREFSFYPVKEGYGPDDIRQKLRELFTENAAETIIDGSEDFFKWYTTIDGKTCYRLLRGQPGGYSSPSRVYFDEQDLQNIRTVPAGEGKATVYVPSHRYERLIVDFESRVPDFETAVFFEFENGKWRISGADLFSSLLSPKSDAGDPAELSTDTIINCIKASVFDLYYYFSVGGCELETDGFSTGNAINVKSTIEGKTSYNIYRSIEGSAGYLSKWREYAYRYCTEDLSQRLLRLDGPVTEHDGKLYNTIFTHCSAEFSPKKVTADRIRITRQDDDHAVVEYVFPVSGLGTVSFDDPIKLLPLEFEFTRTEDGWKISGGDFIDKLDGEYVSIRITDTGDPGSGRILIAAVAAAFLLCILRSKKEKNSSEGRSRRVF